MEDQRRLLIQVILVSWRRESWKPLEAEEEDEEGRSMAPSRLPRCVRRAKLLLRLATSPRVPSSGLDSAGPLDCITRRSFIPILFQEAPTDLYFIANFYTHMTTFGVCHFLPRQVGAAGNTRQQRWFRSRRQRLYFRLAGATCRLIPGTKRCNCFLRVVVRFINTSMSTRAPARTN